MAAWPPSELVMQPICRASRRNLPPVGQVPQRPRNWQRPPRTPRTPHSPDVGEPLSVRSSTTTSSSSSSSVSVALPMRASTWAGSIVCCGTVAAGLDYRSAVRGGGVEQQFWWAAPGLIAAQVMDAGPLRLATTRPTRRRGRRACAAWGIVPSAARRNANKRVSTPSQNRQRDPSAPATRLGPEIVVAGSEPLVTPSPGI